VNHSDVQARMADYLEGDLSLAKRALFDAHLDSCELCAAELAEMRRTITALRSLPSPEPPPDLVDKVMRRIRAGEGKTSWLDHVGGWLSELASPRIAIPATALAAAVAVALVTGDLQLDLPGIAAQQRSSQQAAPPAPDTAEKVARRVSGGAAGGESRSESRPAARITRVSQSTRPQPLAGSQPASVPGADERRAGQSEPPPRFYVESPARREPPVLHTGSSLLEEPAGIVSASTPGRLDLTRPVAGAIPKDQRRLIELDGRLNFLLQEPDEFARWMSTFTVAEQELWLAQFAERAEERGLVQAVSLALGESDDATGQSLAVAFALAAERNNPANLVSPETEPASE